MPKIKKALEAKASGAFLHASDAELIDRCSD